jgi:hypothetical protein
MASFDPNHWQKITNAGLQSQAGKSMAGTPLFDQGTGSVFFQDTNDTIMGQSWQIFPFNTSFYVLRTQKCGSNGFMNTRIAPSNTQEFGFTVPHMRNNSISDDSMLWTISPWGDGTFSFSNAANGTDMNLMLKSDGMMVMMNSSDPGSQNAERFVIKQLSVVNDRSFSTIRVHKKLVLTYWKLANFEAPR